MITLILFTRKEKSFRVDWACHHSSFLWRVQFISTTVFVLCLIKCIYKSKATLQKDILIYLLFFYSDSVRYRYFKKYFLKISKKTYVSWLSVLTFVKKKKVMRWVSGIFFSQYLRFYKFRCINANIDFEHTQTYCTYWNWRENVLKQCLC